HKTRPRREGPAHGRGGGRWLPAPSCRATASDWRSRPTAPRTAPPRLPPSRPAKPSATSPPKRYGAPMAVFVRKLLKIGGLPDALRTEVEAEGVIYLGEYLPVTRRFSGSVPGKRAKGNYSSYVGSLVFTSQRVLGTLSSVPKLAGRTIDQRWDAAPTGPVKADIAADGLRIEVN